MRVAEYARYSTDMQKSSSITDQFRNLDQYAQKEGWTVTARYEDQGISGATNERPGYQKMMIDAEAGKFDVLLIDDLSRLSRNNAEFLRALELLSYWQIRVVAPSDGFDSDRENHELEAGIHGIKNSIFRKDLAKKVHRGLTGLALSGFNCGGRTFGYKHIRIFDPIKKNAYGEPKQIGAKREIDPVQAKIVVQIFEWYAEGRSPRWIAAELNKASIPAPRAKKHWTTSTVYGDTRHGTGVLNNPLYEGKYIWNRSRWIKNPDNGIHKRFERPESEWVITEQPELRIISPGLWDRVKARQAEQSEKSKAVREALHANARTGASGKYLFSGMLKCGVCGSNFVIINQTQYGCGGRKDKGEAFCHNALKISRKVLEGKLLDGIKSRLFSQESLAHFVKEANKLLSEQQRQKAGARDEHSKRLALVEKEIANIVAAIKAGILTQTTKSELEKAEAEKRSLERALNAPSVDKVIAFLPRAIDSYKRLVNDLGHTLQTDIVRARCQLRDILGDEIELMPEEDGLVAKIKGDFAGLLSVAAPKINLAA